MVYILRLTNTNWTVLPHTLGDLHFVTEFVYPGLWWWVAYRILVSAPVPLGLIGFLNLVGLGLGWGFGTKGSGTALALILIGSRACCVSVTI